MVMMIVRWSPIALSNEGAGLLSNTCTVQNSGSRPRCAAVLRCLCHSRTQRLCKLEAGAVLSISLQVLHMAAVAQLSMGESG